MAKYLWYVLGPRRHAYICMYTELTGFEFGRNRISFTSMTKEKKTKKQIEGLDLNSKWQRRIRNPATRMRLPYFLVGAVVTVQCLVLRGRVVTGTVSARLY